MTTFGSESGSMIATTRMGELANCCRIEAIGLMYWVSYSVSPAAVAGISPFDASAAQSRPGRS